MTIRTMIPRAKNYVSISWPRMAGHRTGHSWSRSTRREILEGLIEFTGNVVPHEYWKYHKSNPLLASEVIGGSDFSVRKNPSNDKWEVVRMVPAREEREEQKSPTREFREPEFVLDIPESEGKVREGIEEVKMRLKKALDDEIQRKQDEIEEMQEEEKHRREIEAKDRERNRAEREEIEAREDREEEIKNKITEEVKKRLEEEEKKKAVEIGEVEAEGEDSEFRGGEFPDGDEFPGGEEYRVESSV